MFHTDIHLPVFRSTKAQIEGITKDNFIVKICFYPTCLYLLYFNKLLFYSEIVQKYKEKRLGGLVL